MTPEAGEMLGWRQEPCHCPLARVSIATRIIVIVLILILILITPSQNPSTTRENPEAAASSFPTGNHRGSANAQKRLYQPDPSVAAAPFAMLLATPLRIAAITVVTTAVMLLENALFNSPPPGSSSCLPTSAPGPFDSGTC